MEGPLPKIFAAIRMVRTEKDVVTPSKLLFYKIYADGTHNCFKKNVTDTLFEKINNYHRKFNFIIETNPKSSLIQK